MENEEAEKERLHITKVISVAVSGVSIVKDEWIAVAYDRERYPGQFVKFQKEQEEIQIHFLNWWSSNPYCFIWPELSNDLPGISWLSKGEWNTSCSDVHSKLT